MTNDNGNNLENEDLDNRWCNCFNYLKEPISKFSGYSPPEEFKRKPQFQNFSGGAMRTGPGSASHTAPDAMSHRLFPWYELTKLKYGEEIAEIRLNSFLEQEGYKVICAVWVLGIETDEIIDLEDGFKIIPIEEMPMSLEKINFFRSSDYSVFITHEHNQVSHSSITLPRSAIVKEIDFKGPNIARSFEELEKYSTENNRLMTSAIETIQTKAMLLNLLPEVSCLSYESYVYSHETMPAGDGLVDSMNFGKTYSQYDIHGRKSTKIVKKSVETLNHLHDNFKKLNEKNTKKATLILSKICQAIRRRAQSEEIFLDLGIALEMLVIGERHDVGITKTTKSRALMLLDDEYKQTINDLVDMRGNMAHFGSLDRKFVQRRNIDIDGFNNKFILLVQELFIKKLDTSWPETDEEWGLFESNKSKPA